MAAPGFKQEPSDSTFLVSVVVFACFSANWEGTF